MRENVWLIVNRSFVFVGAFALAAAQPVLSLAAPPGGSAHARPVAPLPRPAAPSGLANRGELNVPPHFDGQLKPLTMPQHFTLRNSTGFNPLPVSAYRRFALLSAPGYLRYPTLYSPACAAGSFVGSPADQRPSEFTLGSLVDGKSNLLSPANYSARFAGKNDASAANSGGITLQAGIYPAGCGASAFSNL